jgi:CHAD domain-containing protein
MSIAADRSKFAFEKAERALLKLSSEQDAESVHGFRTASRRLQILIEELLPNRDRNQKKLLKMLNRIRSRAGKVRDLDVQLAALRSLKVPQQPRRKTQLMHGLIELREKHEKKLRKLLSKNAIREIRKRLKRASKQTRPENGRDALTVARSILGEALRPAGPANAGLNKSGPENTGSDNAAPINEDLLHRYRIVVKRARYAAEFAPKSAASAQLITELKRLQDAVGNWHDWLTLTQSAAKRLGDVNQSSLVAALHNVTAGKFRHAVAALSASPTIQDAAKTVSTASESPASVPSRKVNRKSPTQIERMESAA